MRAPGKRLSASGGQERPPRIAHVDSCLRYQPVAALLARWMAAVTWGFAASTALRTQVPSSDTVGSAEVQALRAASSTLSFKSATPEWEIL